MRIRNPFERLSDWQENYIECLSRACVILEVGLKLHQRIQGVYYSNAESEYDIPQDFEENEIRSEFARTRMQITSIQIKK